MDEKITEQLILEQATEKNGAKKLSCAKAFKIHEEHKIPLRDIGESCNKTGIKIMNCQLGCFK